MYFISTADIEFILDSDTFNYTNLCYLRIYSLREQNALLNGKDCKTEVERPETKRPLINVLTISDLE